MELHAGMHKYIYKKKRPFPSNGPQDLLGPEDFVTCEMNDKDKWLTVEIRQPNYFFFSLMGIDGHC